MDEQDPKLRGIASELHLILAEELLRRIRLGSEASASDLREARQFLRDNGIEIDAHVGHPIRRLQDELPFVGPDQEVM